MPTQAMPTQATPAPRHPVLTAIAGPRFVGVVALASVMALACALTGCGKRSASKLDSPMIEEMVRVGMRATAARDAQAMCALFNDAAEIKLVYVRFSGSEVRSLSKAQYCRLTEEGFAAMPAGAKVRYSADVQSIDIAADGQSAELSLQTSEEAELGGQSLRVTTQQSSTVVLVGGQPRFSRTIVRATAQ